MDKLQTRILALTLSLIIMLGLLPFSASAVMADGLTYEIIAGTVTVTDCDENSTGEIRIPDKIEGYPVTCIGKEAFFGCSDITGIHIPESVDTIVCGAFSNCPKMTEIYADEGNPYFKSDENGILFSKDMTVLVQYPNGKNDKVYTVPECVTVLGDFSFEYCRSLVNISIPDSVTDIGNYTFHRCSSLETIKLPKNITKIGDLVFCDCKKLTEIKIPENVTSIGNCAFFQTGLATVEIPDSVTFLDVRSFGHSPELTSITIPENVTEIGEWAFSTCEKLESVTIGSCVKKIGHGAFHKCEAISKTNYTGTPDTWAKIEFVNSRSNPMDFSKNFYINDILITDIVLHDVSKINPFAFYNCDSLESMILPEGATSIDEFAFKYCSVLKDILIPKSVANIGEEAFFNCNKLTISGFADSFAQRYAQSSSFAFKAVLCGHFSDSYISYENVDATCEAVGYTEGIYCPQCDAFVSGHQTVSALTHTDADSDGLCDRCGKRLEQTQPDVPHVVPDTKPCSCGCHKTGFAKFIWKIGNFFNMIFRKDQYCDCGDKHW